MIGYSFVNLKIVEDNNKDLLKNYEHSIKLGNYLIDNIRDIDNIIYYRFPKNENAFLICCSCNNNVAFLRYENRKFYDSINKKDFISIFSNSDIIDDIIDDMHEYNINPLLSKEKQAIVYNYINHYSKEVIITRYFTDKEQEDFEIKDDGIEL